MVNIRFIGVSFATPVNDLVEEPEPRGRGRGSGREIARDRVCGRVSPLVNEVPIENVPINEKPPA